ncbi:MAG: hypothetical protein AAF063_22460 [Cyanobacteria bacterium J06643_5]
MRIRIQGDENQCFEGVKKLKKTLEILKISDFQPLKENSAIGRIYVEIGEFLLKS